MTFGLLNSMIIMGFKSEVNSLPEKKKLGRPTDNPKGTSVHVRLDEECRITLEKYCQQKNVTKMEATRRGIKKLKEDLN